MGATPPLSPLAPAAFPSLPEIGGVSFATAEAGVRYAGRTDVMLALLAPGTAMAGVFTRSATRSAAVLDCQKKIAFQSEAGAAIVVNSGNANAFTGRNGEAAVTAVTSAVANTLDVPEARVFSSSTGVIGEPLPHDRIAAKLDELKGNLDPTGIENAARAIEPFGHITLRTACNDDWVWTEVEESGTDITTEALERLCAPVFSTKSLGRRAGLGLSLSRDLARSMGGELELIETGPDGTCFRLVLP